MGAIGALLAVSLPSLLGALLVGRLIAAGRVGRGPLIWGYGYLLGHTLLASALGVQGVWFGTLAPWPMLGLTALGTLLLLRRPFQSRGWESGLEVLSIARAKEWFFESPVKHGLILFLWVWLGLRWISLAIEHGALGVYGFDAFSTWLYRARVWVEAQALVSFVPPEVWLADRSGEALALPAAHYPMLVSLIAAWPALVVGDWIEWTATIPWLGLWVALGLGLYGQARQWGVPALPALIGVWALLAAPLVGSQAAIAGYADLWLAAALGFSFMAFLQWARDRDARQGVLAVLCVVAVLSMKAEGLVWAALFVPAWVAGVLGWRGWLCLGLALAAVLAGLAVTGGVAFTLPGVGLFELSLDRVASPMTGVFEFVAQDNVLRPLLVHLFVFGTWHLLVGVWLATLLVCLISFFRQDRGLLAQPWQRAALVWVLAAMAAFYLLFFWTSAAEWVRLGTSGNRIMLHFAPALVFWSLTIWHSLTTQR